MLVTFELMLVTLNYEDTHLASDIKYILGSQIFSLIQTFTRYLINIYISNYIHQYVYVKLTNKKHSQRLQWARRPEGGLGSNGTCGSDSNQTSSDIDMWGGMWLYVTGGKF